MSTSRFSFPGFTPVATADTPTHEVEIGTMEVGEQLLTVHMIRKAGLAFEASFLIAQVLDDTGKTLWKYHKANPCLGVLTLAGTEPLIAFVGRGRDGKVEDVLSLAVLGGPVDLGRKIALKKAAAHSLGRGYSLTSNEQIFVKRFTERAAAKAKEDAEVARKRQEDARLERALKLVKRGEIHVYTREGLRRRGIPVVGEEWQSLSNGAFVVLVESFDESTGRAGKPIEAFRVSKHRGMNPEKGSVVAVFATQPVREEAALAEGPKVLETIAVEKDENVFEVAVYASMDDVRRARELGLNSGALVTAKDRVTPDGRHTIFAVHKEEIKTLGLYAQFC